MKTLSVLYLESCPVFHSIKYSSLYLAAFSFINVFLFVL